jgi:magnesium-transporting ATPase (P-type)
MVTAIGLRLVLAFEPAESGVMSRPPRAPDAPILSPVLLSRVLLVSVLLVSVLFAIGAFGMFAWAETGRISHEMARTMWSIPSS